MELEGKVVIVTGASSGIGLASARALARGGSRVVLAARSLAKLQEEAHRLRSEGHDALACALDVTSDDSVASAVESVLAHYGRIDIVVNNAGNGGALGRWSADDADALRVTFDTHVFGAERVARAALASMRAQGGGAIVNFGSTVAWVPMPMAAGYSAAKAAVKSFSESIRAELEEDGIEVFFFAPPHTSTEGGNAWALKGPEVHTPEWVAEELIRTLRTGKRTHLAGASNRSLLLLARIWPWYASYIMRHIGFGAVAYAPPGGNSAQT